jgi:hypothetical protein
VLIAVPYLGMISSFARVEPPVDVNQAGAVMWFAGWMELLVVASLVYWAVWTLIIRPWAEKKTGRSVAEALAEQGYRRTWWCGWRPPPGRARPTESRREENP